MSNKVKAITVVQFNDTLLNIKEGGNAMYAQLVIACKYITQLKTKKAQDDAKFALATAYKAMNDGLTGKDDYKFESAQSWVTRNVKKYSGVENFTWIKSKTKTAERLRASRAGASAEKETAPAKAPAKKDTPSIVQYRDAIIAQENKIRDEYRNLIPAGKLELFDKTFATFISTLSEILK
jgi:hypothetical protein